MEPKQHEHVTDAAWGYICNPDGSVRKMTRDEIDEMSQRFSVALEQSMKPV